MSNYKIAESQALEVGDLRGELMERRQLPMGVTEFHQWADRIIEGAFIPGATERSLKFALANMITHLGHTDSFKEDAYFIHVLRKTAANQVAVSIIEFIRKEFEVEAAAEKAAKESLSSQTSAPNLA